MDPHLIPYARKTKLTQAYIARWIRPMPAKPFHPHDLSIHLAEAGSLVPLAHDTRRH